MAGRDGRQGGLEGSLARVSLQDLQDVDSSADWRQPQSTLVATRRMRPEA